MSLLSKMHGGPQNIPFTNKDLANRDERAESFEWLFKTFLKCMGGKAPMCILTDEDPAMASAIREVLKNTIHRLCRWHVLKKYKKQLGVLYEMFKHRNFKEKLHFVINHPLTPSEFVAAWKDLVEEFELQGCEVMENLYNLRAEWIPAYFKQIYYARMTSTQRSESVNHMVKTGYLKELTALHRVAAEMNRCIQMRKQKED
ncbi:protein FAR1-RELATED SEQUENCE 5 [Oryza sativa Japonica Group]|uniref:protein FAR1-RELATED SEQUENCE 5 n=1 Tax=Oryza sativa subsp. japonica TaxID=39947 RepID=UPI00339D0E52